MQHLLTPAAQNELAVFRATGELNGAGALFNETYELIANELDEEVREDEDALWDAVVSALADI